MKFVFLVVCGSVAVTAIGVIAGTKTGMEPVETGRMLLSSQPSSLTGGIADSTTEQAPYKFGPP